MFALTICYLTGRSVAKRFDSHVDAEWPPEPARLYFAMVNSLHAWGNRQSECAALLWLESQAPPALSFSNWSERAFYTSFVPPNDVAILPEQRQKRERGWPSVTPESPSVYFTWPDATPSKDIIEGLRAVAERVTYLGHSSSLVAINLCDDPPPPRITPDADGTWGAMRVPRPGHLAECEQRFQRYAAALQKTKGAAPRLPLPTSFMRYAEVRDHAGAGIAVGEFTELHIYSLPPGGRLPLSATLKVTDVLRNAAMSLASQPVIEELSGHQADGSQSKKDRAAFVPVPHVGHPYADGHLLGVAVALPRLTPDIRKAVLAPISRISRLTLGQAGAWELAPSVGADVRGLLRATWTKPSRRWASVTPVVLHRHPRRESASEIIAQSCKHAGLPMPTEIITTQGAPFEGVADAREFRPIAPRSHTHVVLCFDRAVRGPVILGAGRYQGYGLCRPLENT